MARLKDLRPIDPRATAWISFSMVKAGSLRMACTIWLIAQVSVRFPRTLGVIMENRACHRYIYIMLAASLLINSTESWSQNAPLV